MINNQFRNYGHQFLFDEACLRDALGKANFVDIRRMAVGESDDPNLMLVGRHGINVNNEAMNAFGTMVLEARRWGRCPVRGRLSGASSSNLLLIFHRSSTPPTGQSIEQ